MRIKEINVRDYGPVKNFYIRCEDINIIYGRNEAGKTALIDAITGALFHKKSIFPGQDRFEKNSPSLFKKNVSLVLEHLGKEYIFPGSFKFEQIVNLPHYHLARLFIIRSGDLTLSEDEKWQDRIKEFLSGTPVNIERIKEKIGEEVGLTPGGDWSDRQPARKKSQVKEKEERRKDLIAAIERLQQVHQKEKALRDKLQERRVLREKNNRIKLLRAYLRNKRIKEAFLDWSRQKIFFLDYERYLDEDLKLWRQKERELHSLLDLKQNCQKDLQEIEKELQKIKEEEDTLREEKENLINQKDRATALSLFRDAEELPVYKKDIARGVLKLPLYLISGLIFTTGGIFLLFVKGLKALTPTYTFLTILLLGLGIYFLFYYYLIKSKQFGLKKLEESVVERGRKIWSGVKNVDEILKTFHSLNSEILRIESRLEYVSKEREKKWGKLREKQKQHKELELKIQSINEEIKSLRDKTGLSTLSQLEEKLKDKQSINLKIKSTENTLKDLLGTDDPVIWEKEAKKEIREPEIDKEELLKEEEIERKLSELDKDIQDLTAQVTSFTQGELGRLKIKETTGIWEELRKVEDALNRYYLDKRAALLAWDVLSQVGREIEKILLDTVSDEKNGVSFYFNQITSGRYQKVRWDKGSLYVTDNRGRGYSIETLSSGTQDQLFFSLRMGLLKRGFPEGCFILLDDAFLTSDTARRERQIKMCDQLVRQGWQIFYFTVDESLRDLFCRICDIEPIIL